MLVETMHLYLIRHAEIPDNVTKQLETRVPGPELTDVGRDQANRLADRLAPLGIEALYASSLQRTRLTAAPFQARTALSLTELPGLAEIGAGVYEGRADEQARDNYHGVLAAWMGGDLDVRIPGSIDGRQFLDRFDGAIDSILVAGLSAAAAFTHGAAIRAWVGIRAQNIDRSFMEARPVGNTAIIGLERSGVDWVCTSWDGAPFTTGARDIPGSAAD